MKNVAWKLAPGPFYFSWIPPKKGIWAGQCADLDKF